MKIALSINKTALTVAEIDSAGFLSANLNIRQNTEGIEKGSIQIRGYDTSNKDSTRFLDWKHLSLESGDEVHLTVNSSLDPSPPERITHSSDHQCYDELKFEQAELIINSVEKQIEQMQLTLKQMKDVLSESDFKILARSFGRTMATYLEEIKSPIYRRHPKLLPEALKDFSL